MIKSVFKVNYISIRRAITFFCFVFLLHDINYAYSYETLQKNNSIAIDVGHSIKNFGALSSEGAKEYNFNYNIAHMLFAELISMGYDDITIINKNGDNISLRERADQINNTNADLLISIHHDSVQPHYLKRKTINGKNFLYTKDHKGFSIFYSKKNPQNISSLKLSKLVGQNFKKNKLSPSLHHAENIKGENKELVDSVNGIYNADFAILRLSNMPSILIECGIILNPDEELLLKNKEYQEKIVNSIAHAIDDYFTYD